MPENTPVSIFVLDSNVLINDPNALFKFNEHDVMLTMTVLEELDKIKDARNGRYEMVNRDARLAIQNIKAVMNGASPEKLKGGVSIDKNNPSQGRLRFFNEFAMSKDTFAHLPDLPSEVKDNHIIQAALALQEIEKDRVVLVTADLNMQIKARICGLKHVEDYKNEQQIEDVDYLSSGYAILKESFWDDIGEVTSMREGGDDYYHLPRDMVESAVVSDKFSGLHLNMYLVHESSETVLSVFSLGEKRVELKAKPLGRLMNRVVEGISPKNVGQAIALDALMDPDITLVELTGPAGSGKTLLALAAGISQCLGHGGKQARYSTLMVTRTPTDMTESIGFLPGTEEEKMKPWLDAFSDALEVLYAPERDDDNAQKTGMNHREMHIDSINMMKQRVNMQFKSPNFFRGRSLQNVFGILDESQNMTAHQMKAMITRIGSGSKLIVLGNLGQIDNMRYITPRNSGLTHAVEKMKNFEGNAVVALAGGERSPVSAFAEEHM